MAKATARRAGSRGLLKPEQRDGIRQALAVPGDQTGGEPDGEPDGDQTGGEPDGEQPQS
jgi:hypothetical protein